MAQRTARRGRPTTPNRQPISVYLSDRERAMITDAAKIAGVGVAVFGRLAIVRMAREYQLSAEDYRDR